MLWPHFWQDAQKAEWRFKSTGSGTVMERFIENLDKVGPMEWKDEFVEFKTLPRL